MKRLKYIAGIIALLASCDKVTEPSEKEIMEQDSPTYVNVGVKLVGSSETKSVVSPEVENFRSALLLAYNPESGNILEYGSNAGKLQGSQIVKLTASNILSWPLPTNTRIRIYCLINPPEQLAKACLRGLYGKESDLTSEMFKCSDVKALKELETSATGLPKAGIADIDDDDFNEENSSLSIEVKNLFAKFGFTVDTGNIPESAGFKVNRVKVFSSSTSAPYFKEGFRQTDASKLMDFDYATDADLQKLSKGGTQNGIILYTLENCQGNRMGANSWTTVRNDLSSWAEINLCTRLLVEYELNSQVFTREIFLGAGDMKSDFNVRRNMYKNIVMRPGEEILSQAPFFTFADDVIYSHPGDLFRSADGIRTNLYGAGNLSLTFSKADGTTADHLFADQVISGNSYQFGISSSAAPGEYYITGGINEEFFWDTYGTTLSPVTDRVKLIVVRQENLTFERQTANLDIYPYLPVKYVSKESYALSKADSLLNSIRIVSIPENIASTYTKIEKVPGDRGYSIAVTVYPAHPGAMESFTLKYGEEGSTFISDPVTVFEPRIIVLNENNGSSADTPEGQIRIDVSGKYVNTSWQLCRHDYMEALPEAVCGIIPLSVMKKDPLGTKLTTECDGVSNVKLNLRGFANLPGFNAGNYTFSGLNLPIKGTFKYPGGYTVSKEIDALIENPLDNYSYDGQTFEYKVHQGRTAQENHVSVSEFYSPDNMLSWSSRLFSVDLTRGGKRECKGLELWTQYSGIESLLSFKNKSSLPAYTVKIYENLNLWGPVYYGKRISNSVSGESMEFVHSIIRIYNHYNVFAAYDAQEKKTSPPKWDDLGSYNWPIYLLWYYLGCVNAYTVNNFGLGSYGDIMNTMITYSITDETRAMPILAGFSRLTGRKPSGHGKLSADPRNNYQIYEKDGSSPHHTHYVIGYYANPSEPNAYKIYYDMVYIEGADNSYEPIYWRMIAANNQPWFKVSEGNFTMNEHYVSTVARTNTGEYNFSIIPEEDKSNQYRYKDGDGKGYQYIHLFWEDKPGRTLINSKKLNPMTNFSADLCIVNGWYDPGQYQRGIPKIIEKVGMYFYPESTSSNLRAGYPAYYPKDAPYSLNYLQSNMDKDLRFGNLVQRDADAAR